MNTITPREESYKLISSHGIADVLVNAVTRHHSLFARRFYETGNVLLNFSAATVQDKASYLTVQTAVGRHISLSPSFLQYTNHSCDPNIFFDTTAMEVVCIRLIQPGDELCFFYPSTEWEMARPFICNCGSKQCLHSIGGAAHLSNETLAQYRLTDFIVQQLKQRI